MTLSIIIMLLTLIFGFFWMKVLKLVCRCLCFLSVCFGIYWAYRLFNKVNNNPNQNQNRDVSLPTKKDYEQ